jgi:hypothetical protein
MADSNGDGIRGGSVGGERIDAYMESARTVDSEGQKRIRQAVLQMKEPDGTFRLYSADPEYEGVTRGYGPAEFFWRQSGLVVWQAAIVQRTPAARDLYDWASPYLTATAFRGREQLKFWFVQAAGPNLSRTRMKGLVAFYQIDRRITPGNAHDIEHSSHAFSCEGFITADWPFFEALKRASEHFGCIAEIGFVDKSLGDPIKALEVTIDGLASGK